MSIYKVVFTDSENEICEKYYFADNKIEATEQWLDEYDEDDYDLSYIEKLDE